MILALCHNVELFLITQILFSTHVHFCSGTHVKFINEAPVHFCLILHQRHHHMTFMPERTLKKYNSLEEIGMKQGCACVQYFKSVFAQSLCQPSQRVLELLPLSGSHYRHWCCLCIAINIHSVSELFPGNKFPETIRAYA